MTRLGLHVVPPAGEPRDVHLEVDPDAPVSALAAEVARRCGVPCAVGGVLGLPRRGGWLEGSIPFSRAGLSHGDTVLLGRRLGGAVIARPVEADGAAAELAVIGGPDAGATFPIGRGAGPEEALREKAVGLHAAAVRPARRAERGPTGRDGRVAHHRPPRVHEPLPTDVIGVTAPPSPAASARLSAATVLAPAVMGVGLWALTRSAVMLAFMLLSPVMAVWTFFEDRRGGRRSFRAGREEFRAAVADAARRVAAGAALEASRRCTDCPDLAELIDRAAGAREPLWERRPSDTDFLVLRVGTGSAVASTRAEIAPGGDGGLRREAEAQLGAGRALVGVPSTVDLRAAGVLGVAAPAGLLSRVGAGLLIQLAALHGPREVTVVGVLPPGWEWWRWLPHSDADDLPIGAAPPAPDSGDPDVLGALTELVAARRSRAMAPGGAAHLPAVVLVVHDDVVGDRAALAGVLRDGPEVAVHTLWLAPDRRRLPGESGAVFEVISPTEARLLVRGAAPTAVIPDGLDAERAAAVARALAPLVDADAPRCSGALPPSVALSAVLDGPDAADPDAIGARWRAPASGLAAPIGVATEGALTLDLVRDGPHALVAGTTGSGKSELLLTLVLGLAARYPPARLSFLLIDYKGGAAFRDCEALPHVAGIVTDLDGPLAQRALASLRADLRDREAVLRSAGASDLAELEETNAASPPRLVVVVDEFAALAREVPDFVEGLVDLAQRGRSLGIHLVLATQRPAGVVSNNIRANTNLRIALRVTHAEESEDVIGSPDASRVPRHLPGRALVRIGPEELVPFQVARASAPCPTESPPRESARLARAIGEAVERTGARPAPRPWRPPLPERLAFDASASPGTIGRLDRPEVRAQPCAVLDLDADAGLLVMGAGGSGRTTALRTLALSFAAAMPPDRLHLGAIDGGARGLEALAALPHCLGVVPVAHMERVARLLDHLVRLVEQRRAVPSPAAPRVLLTVDDYGAFAAAFERIEYGRWIEVLERLVGEGRAVGVHVAIGAGRRAAVPGSLAAAFGRRLALRAAGPDELVALGVPLSLVRGVVLPPGRGFWIGSGGDGGPALVQVAQASDDDVAQLAARWDGAGRAPLLGELPERLDVAELPAPVDSRRVPIGVSEGGEPTVLDLGSGPVLVCGPPGSGRTGVLRAVAAAIGRAPRPVEPVWVDGRSAAAAAILRGLAETPALVLADDAESLDPDGAEALAARLRDGREPAVVACDEGAARGFSPWLTEVRRGRRGLLLRPEPDLDRDLFGVPVRRFPGQAFPPGRGYLVDGGRSVLVQVASAGR